MNRLFLSVCCWSLVLLGVFLDVEAFTSNIIRPRAAALPTFSRQPRFLSSSDNNNDDKPKEDEATELPPNDYVPLSERTSTRSPLLGIFDAVSSVFSVFIIFFGAAFTCGLVLNLMGYGYQFSLESGLRIDTIEQMQIERQLLQSTSPVVVPSSSSQPSNPLVDFFRTSPYLSALLVTAFVLVVDELFLKDKK